MMKKTLITLFVASACGMSSFAIADSLNIENVDGAQVQIIYGDSIKIESSKTRIYDARHPADGENTIHILVDGGKTLDKKLITSRVAKDNSTGCNYSLLVSKTNGWKLQGGDRGCTASEDHYNNGVYTYTIMNNSSHAIIPSFAKEERPDDYAADSELGYLRPGESRIYNGDSGFWKSLDIHNHSKVRTAIFDPYKGEKGEYVSCAPLAPVSQNNIYRYDADTVCSPSQSK